MRLLELSLRYTLAATVITTSLNAQQDPTDANLREIATSLWLSFNLDTATLALGKASTGFPRILLPLGTNILGSIDKGTGQSSTIILLPSNFAVSVDSLRFRFLISGWRPIEERSPQPGAGRGGSPPQGGRGSAPMLPTYRCQNGDSLQSRWVRTLGTATVVSLKHFRSASAAPCIIATDLPLNDSSGNLSAATGAEAISALLAEVGWGVRRIRLGTGDSSVRWATDAAQLNAHGTVDLDAGTLTIASSVETPERVIAAISQRALADSFTMLVHPPAENGFSFQSFAPDVSETFCRAPFVVSVDAYKRPTTGSRIVIHYARPSEMPCKETSAQRPGAALDDSPPSSLKPPAGDVQSSQGRSRSMTNGQTTRLESRATIRSRLSASELIAHYSAQLRQQGWTSVDSGIVNTSLTMQFRVTHTDGSQWTGELTATPLAAPSTQISLKFAAQRSRER